MKNTWQKYKLSDVIELIGGGTPKTSVPGYWGGEIPWLSVVDFNDDNRHVHETEKTITEEGLKNSSTKILPKGALILSARGTVGALAQLSVPMAFNQSCYGIIAKKQTTNDYLYYLINNVVGDLQKKGHGSVFNTVTRETFTTINILLPPIEEQRKIAAVLGALDDKIELNNKINNNLEQQAQALFKSWFVDFEPFGGTMPEDWEVGNLLDIADYLNGLAMQKFRPEENEKGLPVLKIKELRQGFCDASSEFCSPNVKSEYIIDNGDVIFSWSGSLLVDFWCGGKCGLNQHLFKVLSKKFDKWFYYSWTKHHLDRFIAVAADKATTMGHIKRDELEKAEVIIPSSTDYKKIAKILSPIYDLIIQNRIENTRLAALRDTLLPKLMKGEIDVSNVDISELPSADKSQLIEDDSVKF